MKNIKDIKKILIIGGGTSGWMAAGYIEANLPGADITLIESESIPIIGVGESTLPTLGRFMRKCGLDENVWMPNSNAVYKYGNIKEGWDHPEGKPCIFSFWENKNSMFDTWMDEYTSNHITREQLLNRFSEVCNESTLETPEDYETMRAYHVDAALLGRIIKDNCKNVKHQIGTLDELPEGYDLYIDCTGFGRKFLKDKTLVTNEHHLVDRALVCQFEIENETNYTQSIARNAGWQFIVNLTNRVGSGYIYSSKHISDEDAMAEYLEFTKHRTRYQNKTPKLLKWVPGYLKNPWVDNVVAVGLSAGFTDPLEANALYMTQLSIEMIVKCISRGYSQETYNRMMGKVLAENSEFILHHYMLTKRNDTPFWEHYSKCDRRKSLWHIYNTRRDRMLFLYPDAIYANLGAYYDEFTYYKKQETIDAT